MKSIRFSFGRVASLLLAMFVLSGFISCVQPDNSPDVIPENVSVLQASDSISGKWMYTSYFGETRYFSYNDLGCDTQIAPGKIDTASYGSHEGTVYIAKVSETSGYLYYQLADNITGYDDSYITEDNLYGAYTVECKGKWSAVYYEDLSDDSVKMSDAFKETSKYDFPDSLKDVVELYTDENEYFNTVAFTRVTE